MVGEEENQDEKVATEVQEEKKNENFYIWILATVLGVCVLGGICFVVFKKR